VTSRSLPDENLMEELWNKASPTQFEKLLGRLLTEMGFSDVKITGKSGDGGVDLRATWTQTEVPGLEVDLQFVIQAKRTNPSLSINPRFVRELRGALKSGEWGLLITTGKVSEGARRSGIEDPSRVISIIDGKKLAELCVRYKVGVREYFEVDLRSLEEQPAPTPQQAMVGEETATASILSKALNETFEKFGNSPIYKSEKTILLARWSQFYEKKWSNYWYGVTAKDLERVKEYNIGTFAFVCDNKGVVLIDARELNNKIEQGELWRSPPAGDLRHYHIHLKEANGKLLWHTKDLEINVTSSYCRIKK